MTRSGTTRFHKAKDEWKETLLLRADEAKARGAEKDLDPIQLCDAAEALKPFLYKPENIKLAMKLADSGIDEAFCDCAAELSGALRRAVREAPRDLRSLETITPAEQDTVTRGGQMFSRLRDSATRAAKNLGAVDDVEGLGRGQTFNLTSPAGVQEALRTFKTGAATRPNIMDEAGIGERHLAQLDEVDLELERIISAHSRRVRESREKAVQVDRLVLAIWCLFNVFAARTESALVEDTTGTLDRALSLVPRRQERRSTAAAKPEPQELTAKIARDAPWYPNPVAGETPAGAFKGGTRVQKLGVEGPFASVRTEDGVKGWVMAEMVG